MGGKLVYSVRMKNASLRVPFSVLLMTIAVCAAIATADAWLAFSRIDFLVGRSASDKAVRYWFCFGPLLFFPTGFLGLIFALLVASHRLRQRLGRFQIGLVWIPASLLFAGAFVFEGADLFTSGHSISPHGFVMNALLIPLPMLVSAGALNLTALKGAAALRSARAVQSVVLQDHKSNPWKRVAITTAKAIGAVAVPSLSVLAVLASCLLLFLASCTPPSLDELARRFPEQRRDLETVVRMSDQDRQLDVIDPTWMQTRTPPVPPNGPDGTVTQVQVGKEYMSYNPDTGISRDRYDEYMKIFMRDAVTQGIRTYGDAGDVFFIIKSEGLLDSGYSNGYVFCGSKEVKSDYRLPPCSSSLTEETHPITQGGEAYSFRKVADHWYVFSEGPS